MRSVFMALAVLFSASFANADETPIYSRAGDVADCPPFIEVNGKKVCPFVSKWEDRVKDLSKVKEKCMLTYSVSNSSLRTVFGMLTDDSWKLWPLRYEESSSSRCPGMAWIKYTTIDNMKESEPEAVKDPTKEKSVNQAQAGFSSVSQPSPVPLPTDNAQLPKENQVENAQPDQSAKTQATLQEPGEVEEVKNPQNLYQVDKKLKLPKSRPAYVGQQPRRNVWVRAPQARPLQVPQARSVQAPGMIFFGHTR